MSEDKKIRVGSRKSELALIQTRHVITLLSNLYPEKEFEIVTMTTLGDRILDKPLPKIGEKSLFTQELEAALATGCVDFVVHSLKDLPTTLPEGMAIGAVLKREDPRDALVIRKDTPNLKSLSELPSGSTIGTSSLRRTAQLSRVYPHLKIDSIRGNLNTRLRKLDELDKYQAIVLARAGLTRMGWADRVSQVLDCDEMMYAVGQGALAVECRENDAQTIELLSTLHDAETVLRIVAERSFLKTLGGGCSAPVAVSSSLTPLDDKLCLKLAGGVWSLDGKTELKHTDKVTVELTRLSETSNIIPRTIDLANVGEPSNITTAKNILNSLREDIKRCPYQIPCKRRKIEENDEKNDLLEDPHDQCPVSIPVGLDFMGKCPYLESQMGDNPQGECPYLKSHANKCPVNAEILNINGEHSKSEDIMKCPYLSGDKTIEVLTKHEIKTYAGVAPPKKCVLKSLEEAEQLGQRLAEMLVQKGALPVMQAAQAAVRA